MSFSSINATTKGIVKKDILLSLSGIVCLQKGIDL